MKTQKQVKVPLALAFSVCLVLGLCLSNLSKTLFSQEKYLVLGASRINIKEHDFIGCQVDRVIRDVNVFKNNQQFGDCRSPFYLPTEDPKEIINYHEGRLVRFLMNFAKIKVIGLAPGYGRRTADNKYYASDGNGGFPFLIKPLRLKYSTAMFNCADEFMLPDTHGFHLVAGQAIRLKQLIGLQTVIACMDQPEKAQAALYLAQNSINCFAPCDQFAGDLVGYRKSSPGAAMIIPTAPIRQNGNGAVIGNQIIKINLKEPIVVQNTLAQEGHEDYYCQTAGRYFKNLNSVYKLNLKITEVMAGIGETDKVVAKAREIGAKVIGVRIFHHQLDKPAVAQWLKENKEHRAILFHSAAYIAGYEMFFEFPKQTSFGDLDPQFE